MALRRTQAMAMTAGVSAIALVLTACGSKASTSSAGGGTSSAASGSGSAGGATFTACMVTDTGGIDDKSFNASAWAGMQQAQTDGKAKVQYVVSKTEADYKPNIAKLEGQNCKLIVTVGGLMGDATRPPLRRSRARTTPRSMPAVTARTCRACSSTPPRVPSSAAISPRPTRRPASWRPTAA